jgi:hypothetical protein
MVSCVLKKWIHYKIGQCVRPSIYTITLHNFIRVCWNFVHRIVSSISRSSSKIRMVRQEMAELSQKMSLHCWPLLRGVQGNFFIKKYFSQNYLKHIWIDSVVNADSEYDISFEPNRSFLTKSFLNKVPKCTKTVSRDQCAWMCLRWLVVLGFSRCMVLSLLKRVIKWKKSELDSY